MQSIRFEREKMNHYMVMSCQRKIDKDTYGVIVLELADIPKFMNCEIREIDGEQLLYYKLKYKTSLKQVLGEMVLTYEKVKHMLCSIVDAIKETEDYLLNPDSILWKSDCTFIEVNSGKLIFTYAPENLSEPELLKNFLLELLQYIDKKNQQSYLYIMEFYNLVTDPDCTVKQLEKYVNGYNSRKEQEKSSDEPIRIEGETEKEKNNLQVRENMTKEKNRKKKLKESTEQSLICIIVLSVVNFVVVCLLLFEIWTYQYIWVLIFTLFLLFVAFLMRSSSKEEEDVDRLMEEYWKESEKHAIDGSEKLEILQSIGQNDTTNISEEMDTIVLTSKDSVIVVEDIPREMYLKSMNPHKYKDVIMDRKSIVLGSMRNGCNYQITEQGISRMHAKVMKKEDGLYLMDMNSTNGTFINDEFIISGKEYSLVEGDVVSLSHIVTFVIAKKED